MCEDINKTIQYVLKCIIITNMYNNMYNNLHNVVYVQSKLINGQMTIYETQFLYFMITFHNLCKIKLYKH